jgi:hypothetical protein
MIVLDRVMGILDTSAQADAFAEANALAKPAPCAYGYAMPKARCERQQYKFWILDCPYRIPLDVLIAPMSDLLFNLMKLQSSKFVRMNETNASRAIFLNEYQLVPTDRKIL